MTSKKFLWAADSARNLEWPSSELVALQQRFRHHLNLLALNLLTVDTRTEKQDIISPIRGCLGAVVCQVRVFCQSRGQVQRLDKEGPMDMLHPTSESDPPIDQAEHTASATGEPPTGLSKSLHETWLDHLTLLLHAAAGIEHELMVQYLYAAYSLGGDQVPANQRHLVRLWRRNILAVAKEEMGHFLTVQNILTVLGAPLVWGRGNYPWDNQYFPLKTIRVQSAHDGIAVLLRLRGGTSQDRRRCRPLLRHQTSGSEPHY